MDSLISAGEQLQEIGREAQEALEKLNLARNGRSSMPAAVAQDLVAETDKRLREAENIAKRAASDARTAFQKLHAGKYLGALRLSKEAALVSAVFYILKGRGDTLLGATATPERIEWLAHRYDEGLDYELVDDFSFAEWRDFLSSLDGFERVRNSQYPLFSPVFSLNLSWLLPGEPVDASYYPDCQTRAVGIAWRLMEKLGARVDYPEPALSATGFKTILEKGPVAFENAEKLYRRVHRQLDSSLLTRYADRSAPEDRSQDVLAVSWNGDNQDDISLIIYGFVDIKGTFLHIDAETNALTLPVTKWGIDGEYSDDLVLNLGDYLYRDADEIFFDQKFNDEPWDEYLIDHSSGEEFLGKYKLLQTIDSGAKSA